MNIFVVTTKVFLRVTEICGNENEITMKKVSWRCCFQSGTSRFSHQCLGTVSMNITTGKRANQYLTIDLKLVSPKRRQRHTWGTDPNTQT